MIVTLLGTGTSSGVPLIGCTCEVCRSIDFRDKRLRTSIHLAVGGKSFVVDTGPDFRQQMLRAGIRHLDAVLFTHEHKDHTAGLDEVRAYNFLQRQDIPVYAHKRVLTQLQTEFAYIFAEKKYPGIPRLQLNEINNEPFELEGVPIIPIDVLHHRLPVFGYRIQNFTYLTDLNYISDQELEKVYGTEVLLLDALQIEPHISHFTLDQAIALVERIQPEKAYFIHISHKLGLHREVEKRLPESMRLGYDGLKISL
ncbi:MBL fold metallo-hydrolase [Larkinella arboricola]|uniref:Phosphoribosyl 1,2-cyclic phosphate phosphodiesterase n=1 Tax=Larkinella arboricola TaxID=643671 RepID=A0A327XFU5_LARAB|nr:MBL fold metallo-hydrolase [Larkinella arboricola]RAK03046.1 phosphoribosyl 1,2-cyclic phosphate phosphodiesterase [Larkinella arboricola]